MKKSIYDKDRNKLEIGFNLAAPHSTYTSTWNAYSNWMKRALVTKGVNNVVSVAPDNRPLILSGATSFDICDPTVDLIDWNNYPVASGMWTFFADEINPTQPLIMELGSYHGNANIVSTVFNGINTTGINNITLINGGNNYNVAPKVIIEGDGFGAKAFAMIKNGQVIYVGLIATGVKYTWATIKIIGGNGSGAVASITVGNVISHKMWRFAVSRDMTKSNDDLGICVVFNNPTQSGNYPYTLVNEKLYPPAAYAVNRMVDGADQNLKNWLNTHSGNGPYIFRYADSTANWGGNSSIKQSCDLKQPDEYTWAARANYPLVHIINIRNYNLVQSPNIYVLDDISEQPVAVSVPSTIFGNLPNGQWFVGEVTTDVPHGLRTGDLLNRVSGLDTFPVSNNGGSVQVSLANVGGPGDLSYLIVYVTSLTTFVCYCWWGAPLDGIGQPDGICNVIGSNIVDYIFEVVVPDMGTLPFKSTFKITVDFENTNHLINIPMGITKTCCASIARELRDTIPPGRFIFPQFSNEVWNLTFQAGSFIKAMGSLGVWSNGQSVDRLTALVLRQAQHHQTFIDVFNETDIWGNSGRGNEIVRCFAGQFTYPDGELQGTVNIVNQYKLPMDVFLIADYRGYIDEGYPNPCAKLAVASIFKNNPLSIAHNMDIPSWTRDQYLDYYRYCIRYDSDFIGYYAQNMAILATYQATPDQPSGFIPFLMGYEGGTDSLIPNDIYTGPDANGFTLNNQGVVDLFYSQGMYDVILDFFDAAERGGLSGIALYHLAGGVDAGHVWPNIVYASQRISRGLKNKFWMDTGKSQHSTNDSVKLQAYRDRIDQVA